MLSAAKHLILRNSSVVFDDLRMTPDDSTSLLAVPFSTTTLSSSREELERALAIQAASAAFPPPKAAPQASRLRLVRRSTPNPSHSPFQRAYHDRFGVCRMRRGGKPVETG